MRNLYYADIKKDVVEVDLIDMDGYSEYIWWKVVLCMV